MPGGSMLGASALRRAMIAGAVWLLSAATSFAQGTFSPRTIDIDGERRSYLIYSPVSAREAPRPLVFLLHGGGGSARQIAEHVGDGFAALAEREGFYVVVPDAVGRMWDFGVGRISARRATRTNDRALFEALLNSLPAELPIDRRRIFATGISRGGVASYFIACSFPGRIRAIAPIAMPLPDYLETMCEEGPPVGVAIFNGTADPLVPYDGGWITIGRNRRDRVLSTDATVDLWRGRNGCSDAAPARDRIDAADDRTHVERSAWRSCDAPVVLHRIVGGGHTWPMSRANLREQLVGVISQDIDATDEIWAFFSQFR